MKLTDNTVFITGGTSGIGRALAEALHSRGNQVIVAGRRQALLDEIAAANPGLDTVLLDIGDPAQIKAVAAEVIARHPGLNVVINNAGIMPLSPLASLKTAEWMQMVDVNIKGVLNGIAAVLPEFTARGAGHIINLGSIGALSVVPTAAVYCATKHAVRAISEGLRQEREDLRVTCIHPGVVESELASTITDPAARAMMDSYRAIALQPDAIGRAVRYAIEQPDDVDVNEIVVRPTRSAN